MDAFTTGRGKIVIRSKYEIIDADPKSKDDMNKTHDAIYFTELPYQVNKRQLIKNIAEQVKDKRLEGISDLRDETDRNGMRIVIELKRDANAQFVLNQLYTYTQLQDTCAVNMLAIVRNEPKVLNLAQILDYYIEHQESVITNRVKFDLAAELLESPLSEASQSFVPGGPVFLFASVRDCEETRLPGHFSRILKAMPDARIIVVPRHLHRVAEWKTRLDALGFDPLLITEAEPSQPVPHGRILIWDRFGDLPGLYASAQAVFVGGSFGMGGQNFLESLAAGRIPCIGPSADNFLWAMDSGGLPSLEESGLLRVAPTPEAVMDAMLELASSPLPREEVRKRFRTWLEPRLGTSARCAALLEQAVQA